ncbi:MAG: DsrE family protein [Cytophagales bacterium]|nr:DsrE family protein [Cytophagales bacterium]
MKFLYPLLLLFPVLCSAQNYQYPSVQGYGAVVNYEGVSLPSNGAKIVIDMTTANPTEQGHSQSMDRVARLINLYGLGGVTPEQLEIVVVVHSAAYKTILSNEAYRKRFRADNPDLDALNTLTEAGVQFMVCGQSINARQVALDEINPNVKLAISAITTLVEHQQKGFALL